MIVAGQWLTKRAAITLRRRLLLEDKLAYLAKHRLQTPADVGSNRRQWFVLVDNGEK